MRGEPPPVVPRLHVVTDALMLARKGWSGQARAVLEAGGDEVALHVRGPGLPGRALCERVQDLLEPAERAGAALVVNERVDVALVLPVRGVQLPESSLPVAVARRLLGEGVRIGASIHDGERAERAEREGADWLVAGTVFATPTHPDRVGGGVRLVQELVARTRLPLIAIGGIVPERVPALVQAGAHGVAVVSGVWQAPDPAAAVGAYLHALG